MSRMRVLKPEFFSDSSVVRCSPLARLLYVGSWVFADDNGILPDDMLQLKMQALPGDNVDCEELKCEIVNAGLWLPYMAKDRQWLLIRGFHKHQILDRPTPMYPLPEAAELTAFGLAVVTRSYSRNGKSYTASMLVVDQSSYIRRIYDDFDRIDDDQSSYIRLEEKRTEEKRKEEEYVVSATTRSSALSDDATTGETETDAVSASKPTCDEKLTALEGEVVSAWNALSEPYKPVKRVGHRRKHLRARLRDVWWRENWRGALERISAIPGLAGKNERSWIASFDWFVKPNTVTLLLEGKYDGWGVNSKNGSNDDWLNVGLETKGAK